MSEKRILLTVLIALCLISLTGCVKKPTFSSPCCKIPSGHEATFMIVSDPHYLSRSTYDENEAFNDFCCTADGKLIIYTEEIIDTLIWEIENKKPDFLIISGDLTCNGEKESHLDFAKKLEKIEIQGTCVFVIPGNHDIENPWARNYFGKESIITESITDEEFYEIYHSFGYMEAISKDEHSLSYLLTPSEDVWLLMLDSTKKNKGKPLDIPEKGGAIPSKTLNWIEECAKLAKENNARLIASMHHSLLEHNSVINKDYVIDNKDEVLKLFKKLGIEIVLTGHIHLQSINSYEEGDYRLYDIATGSILAYPNVYGELKHIPGYGFEYKSYKIDVEGWSKENNIKDDNLLNFKMYSKEYFKEKSYEKYYKVLKEKLDYDNEESYEALADSVAKMNVEYFQGQRNDVLKKAIKATEYQRLMESLPDCLKAYILSMGDCQFTDNNTLLIPQD